MNKFLFIALAVSVFAFCSCNMTRRDQRLSYNSAAQLETGEVLTGQVAQGNHNTSYPLNRIEPKLLGDQSGPAFTLRDVPRKLIPQSFQKKEHRRFAYTMVQNQVKHIERIITKPEFESHLTSIKDKTLPDYGQISSFFLVFGALFIIVVNLINPELFLSLGIAIPCLALFIIGIVLFFFWLRNNKDTDPMGLSYGEFALMFLLAGLAALLFAYWLIYYFSFLLLAGALVLGIIWLKHLKDTYKVPGNK